LGCLEEIFPRLVPATPGVYAPGMSWRPAYKLSGIGSVFQGADMLDIAEYDLEVYEENPDDHEHHAGNWKPGMKRIQGTVTGELPIRKELRLVTEEGHSLDIFLKDSFGSVVIMSTLAKSA
jgi:hypothetical protein